MLEFLDNAHMDRDIKKKIFDIVEEYRESVGDKIVESYNSVADTLNKMDNFKYSIWLVKSRECLHEGASRGAKIGLAVQF